MTICSLRRTVRALLIFAAACLISSPVEAQDHLDLFRALDEDRGGYLYFYATPISQSAAGAIAHFVRFDSEHYKRTGEVEVTGEYSVMMQGYQGAAAWVARAREWVANPPSNWNPINGLLESPRFTGREHESGEGTDIHIFFVRFPDTPADQISLRAVRRYNTDDIWIDLTREEADQFVDVVEMVSQVLGGR